MAKKRSVETTRSAAIDTLRPTEPVSVSVDRWRRRVAIGVLAGMGVYVAYHPVDSIAVEQGGGLWFTMLTLIFAVLVPVKAKGGIGLLSWTPWSLAAWISLAAAMTSATGNLRFATNEAWIWIAGAAVFTASRRLLVAAPERRSLLALALILATGLAVDGLHQQFVWLPAQRQAYRDDPDQVLRMAGIDAPPGTAQRMQFENRLFDGGPSATFALANSWAAVLLIGIIVGCSVLRYGWSHQSIWQRIGLAFAIAIAVAALLAARSRSATLAMLIGLGFLWLISSRIGGRNRTWIVLNLSRVTAVAVAVVGLIALLGNREWFEQAPASLAFRFQYWRSTWQMVLDRPWFGAGPGNFQAVYDGYREAATTEQISDPHNFLFETLASGGFVAALLLVAMFAAGISVARHRMHAAELTASDGSLLSSWIVVGGGISFALVWLIGWATLTVPDIDASLFVLPIMAVLSPSIWRAVESLSDQQVDAIAALALTAILIHLSVAGGWTVPGVSLWVWIFAAILTASGRLTSEGPRSKWLSTVSRADLLNVLSMVALLITLWFLSIRPVMQQQRWSATAEMAQSTGQFGKARLSLQRAMEADPWAVTPAMWLADLYRWQWIRDADDTESRARWLQLVEEARSRGGKSPSILRQIGIGYVHAYQRYGRRQDLSAAAQTFGEVVRLSPSDQWSAAQLAVILRETGDRQRGDRMARVAQKLSFLGGNLERALFLQSIYVARPIGSEAASEPIRAPANELLGVP